MFQFILASQSPRRRHLIRLLGYPYETAVALVNENSITAPNPAVNAKETAQLKAAYIAQQYQTNPSIDQHIIVAADTIVALEHKILGKPNDSNEAYDMLTQLRGRKHHVHTGVCLIHLGTGEKLAETNTAVVTMRNYTDDEIHKYVASGDPLDKAGAYGIQHTGFHPVTQLQGCFMGVMGLSICHLIQMLAHFDVPLLANQTAVAHNHQNTPCPIFTSLQKNWLHHPSKRLL